MKLRNTKNSPKAEVWREFLSFILFLFCSTSSYLQCAFLDKRNPFLDYGTTKNSSRMPKKAGGKPKSRGEVW